MAAFRLGPLLAGVLVQSVFLFTAHNVVSAATANDNGEYMGLYFSDEELVETATRAPKPITRVPENVTIITAEEIEAMQAHTVADVLTRVAGVFFQSSGHDFGSQGTPLTQGADYEHTLIMLDGIRWNESINFMPYTIDIPVQIIKRIEIIKGASSSTWGSAMGGVINIITKEGHKAERPLSGMVAAGLAEKNTEFYDAELKGGIGRLSYYLYGGGKDSGGLRDDRYFDRNSLYGKFNLDLPGSSLLTATIGYSDPRQKILHLPVWDATDHNKIRSFFYSINADLPLASNLNLNLSFYNRNHKSEWSEFLISTSELYWNYIYDNQNMGGSGRLVWTSGANTLVLGAEIERTEVDASYDDASTIYSARTILEENWAVYLNDTFTWKQLTVVPGIRYDHNSVTDDMFNPSLGLLYRLRDDTIMRLTVARGFRRPTASLVQGALATDGLTDILYANSSLNVEKVWSYQAGIETAAFNIGRLKAALFFHNAEDAWEYDDAIWEWVNGSDKERIGLELEFESVPVYDLAFKGGYAFVRTTSDTITSREDMYEVKLGLTYDNPHLLRAELFGTYVRWNQQFSSETFNGSYDDFIWDLTVARSFTLADSTLLEGYLKVHNIFNGIEYFDDFYLYTERWVEGGLKLRF